MSMMKRQGRNAEKRQAQKAEAPDPLGEALGVVDAWMDGYQQEHQREKPPTLSCGYFGGSRYMTVSLPGRRSSCSGWGPSWTKALEQLEGKLERDDWETQFKPWKTPTNNPTPAS